MDYTIYMHISPSGKRYIGITSQEPEKRWRNGCGYKKQSYFYRAINKYGWENFEHIIIAKGLSKDEACWLEIELIKIWDTTSRNKGYNLTDGGEGTVGYHHTDENKKKMSELKQDVYTGENNPMYGKHHTKESKEKNRIHNSGINHVFSKGIICLTTNKIFYSLREAEKYYNVYHSNISKCCRGKGYSYAGKLPNGTPLRWMYLEDFLEKCEYTEL